jgi:plasmid stabilization system protein ParE
MVSYDLTPEAEEDLKGIIRYTIDRERGTVGDFVKEKIQSGSKLSIVSAYFTIYDWRLVLLRI